MENMITKICQDLSRGVLFETCRVSDRRPDKYGCFYNRYYASSCVQLYNDAACMYCL